MADKKYSLPDYSGGYWEIDDKGKIIPGTYHKPYRHGVYQDSKGNIQDPNKPPNMASDKSLAPPSPEMFDPFAAASPEAKADNKMLLSLLRSMPKQTIGMGGGNMQSWAERLQREGMGL